MRSSSARRSSFAARSDLRTSSLTRSSFSTIGCPTPDRCTSASGMRSRRFGLESKRGSQVFHTRFLTRAAALNGLVAGLRAFGLGLPEQLTDHTPVNYTARLEEAG